MDWLSKLDPNTIAGLLTVIGSLATWLYHKARGEKADSFDDTIRGLGKQAVHELLSDPKVSAALSPTDLTARASIMLRMLASRIGIPDNAIVAALIRATAQHVVGDVLAELRAADGLSDQLQQLQSQVAAIPASIAQAEAAGYARGKLIADQFIERTDKPQENPILPTATALPPK